MNFLIFRDFSIIFLNFSEFILELFRISKLKIIFTPHANMVGSRHVAPCVSNVRAHVHACVCACAYVCVISGLRIFFRI